MNIHNNNYQLTIGGHNFQINKTVAHVATGLTLGLAAVYYSPAVAEGLKSILGYGVQGVVTSGKVVAEIVAMAVTGAAIVATGAAMVATGAAMVATYAAMVATYAAIVVATGAAMVVATGAGMVATVALITSPVWLPALVIAILVSKCLESC